MVEGEIGGNCDGCNCVDSNTEPAAQHSCFGFGCGNVNSIYLVDIRLETVDARTKHLT